MSFPVKTHTSLRPYHASQALVKSLSHNRIELYLPRETVRATFISY